ncbi:hypothetical protein JXM67_13510 [candidate division WOR-3 bacterium]|nr:hypothetical protein [candidate division WOR-3 bacterium]
MIKQGFRALSVLVILSFTACNEPEGAVFDVNDTLPLVMSIPTDTGSEIRFKYVKLTDSLVVTIELVPTQSGSFDLMLCRYPYLDPDDCDTVIFPFPAPDTMIWNSFTWPLPEGYGFNVGGFGGGYSIIGDCARFPNHSWILLPFSVGDSSAMIQLGSIKWENENLLGERALCSYYRECHYLVDAHSRYPRTVAKLKGIPVDYKSPYLLLLTRYTNQLSTSFPNSMVYKSSYDNSELLVIDMQEASIISRFPVDQKDSKWELRKRSSLTADNKLYYTDEEWVSSNRRYYLPGLKALVPRERLQNCSLCSGIFWFLNERIRFLRTYEMEKKKVKIWDLVSGDTIQMELLIPDEALSSWPSNFHGAEGEIVFISDPPGEMYGSFFIEVPTIFNLEGPPLELRWFRRTLPLSFPWRWEVQWTMSKEGRWLVADTHLEKGDEYKGTLKTKPGYTYLIPTEELSYPESERKEPNLVKLPQDIYPRDFLPGEDWIVVGGRNFPFFRLLHIPDGRLFPLKTEGEVSCHDYYFSPDGRYVAYTCKIEGKEGFYLQVRKLP